MPYKLKGNVVYRADTGKKVGKSKSKAKAKAHLRVLNAVEHSDWRPTRKK